MPTLLLASAGGGFDPLDVSGAGGLIWTLVIFFIALPFMWKVVMGPVAKALTERDAKASEAIVAAQRASEQAQKARDEVESKLTEARADAAKTMADARTRAEAREREIVSAAQQQAQVLLDNAGKAIRAEQEKAVAAIRREVVDLSLSAASKVLKRGVNSDDDRRLAQEAVALGQQSSAARSGS
ncbi:MAG: F0F1 ATP synthase subunit B [Planctomycetes bacterium]|nr:F0F1 ATP synthase subunit B [Planctomycetota bacterium]